MAGRPRIVLLSSYPPDHQSFEGGVQTATAALLEGLEAYTGELDVHVVSSAAIEADAHVESAGISFHFLADPHSRWARPRFPARLTKAARLMRSLRPDLVHCHDTIVLAPAAFASRCVRVFSIHGIKSAEASFRTGWERASASFEAVAARPVLRRFDAFVANSEYSARRLPPDALVFPVPNAVSRRYFGVERDPSPDGRLVFVGALTPLKCPMDLVRAHHALVHDHPRLVTHFCGPIEDAAYARALRSATDGDLSVVWEGVVPPERVADLLRTATALVLPSMQENVPMVVAEAMAAGVPVVATRVGGVPEMLDDGRSGLLFEPGDPGALRGRLAELLGDREGAARIAAEARRVARERYSPEAVAAATMGVYRRLLSGNRTAA